MSTTLSKTTRYARGPAAAALILTAGLVPPAAAGIDPLSGIDFVQITDPGNAAWTGNPGPGIPGDSAIGRGAVPYSYHIGRMEVTTSQWVEFYNAAFDRPDPLPHLIPPSFWGAAPTTPTTPGGRRWTVPAGNENLPVGNISWRMAAMYCNWLHNGKGTDRAAFMDGAYDVNTFGFLPGNIATDQVAHHPYARYWIPTWDEWLKAAHYDPDKNGPGDGGWWMFSNGTDTPYAYGPPGQGEANAHFGLPGQAEFLIPLGAYPDVTSPWGLLDTAGGSSEWTETLVEDPFTGERLRFFEGSVRSGGPPTPLGSLDWIQNPGGEFPHISTFNFGLRVASVVPAPSAWMGLVGVIIPCVCRRKRRVPHESSGHENPPSVPGSACRGCGGAAERTRSMRRCRLKALCLAPS